MCVRVSYAFAGIGMVVDTYILDMKFNSINYNDCLRMCRLDANKLHTANRIICRYMALAQS